MPSVRYRTNYMGLFGSILKTAVDVVTIPVDVVSDVATLGGAITETNSAIETKIKRLGNDLEDIRDDVSEL